MPAAMSPADAPSPKSKTSAPAAAKPTAATPPIASAASSTTVPQTITKPTSPEPAHRAMYESPSPSSTASIPDTTPAPTTRYGSIPAQASSAQPDNATIPLQSELLRSLSPIKGAANHREGNVVSARPGGPAPLPYNDMPEEDVVASTATAQQSTTWRSSFVPVLSGETTALLATVNEETESLSGSDALLSQSRADLERARLASTQEARRSGMERKDRYILGCSFFFMVIVVFIILVSGMTTILANRNYPKLEAYSDWHNGGIIPLKYGCHAPNGKPVSFPLHWRNVPRAATNLVLLFANPGAIAEHGLDPVHWFVTDIPLLPDADGVLPANASEDPALIPAEAKQRPNAFSKEGKYWPPCSANGTSFFVIHVYAIEASPEIQDGIRDARDIMNRFQGVPVARITGTYGKKVPLATPTGKDKDDKRKGHHGNDQEEHDEADNSSGDTGKTPGPKDSHSS